VPEMLKNQVFSLSHIASLAQKLYRVSFLYLIRCGTVESVPSRRILSAS
jgi:hypothetical protein